MINQRFVKDALRTGSGYVGPQSFVQLIVRLPLTASLNFSAGVCCEDGAKVDTLELLFVWIVYAGTLLAGKTCEKKQNV